MFSILVSSRRLYFYPRPPRGGRPRRAAYSRSCFRISIHALREEGDSSCLTACSGSTDFYPRPPRGGRPTARPIIKPCSVFLSTPSARRATHTSLTGNGHEPISIHALREEGDAKDMQKDAPAALFLSTPSARRATARTSNIHLHRSISIHALREEGDRSGLFSSRSPYHFYPRPPRGGRQQKQRQNLYFLINYTTFCTNLEEL